MIRDAYVVIRAYGVTRNIGNGTPDIGNGTPDIGNVTLDPETAPRTPKRHLDPRNVTPDLIRGPEAGPGRGRPHRRLPSGPRIKSGVTGSRPGRRGAVRGDGEPSEPSGVTRTPGVTRGASAVAGPE